MRTFRRFVPHKTHFVIVSTQIFYLRLAAFFQDHRSKAEIAKITRDTRCKPKRKPVKSAKPICKVGAASCRAFDASKKP
ncbi:hypothetical protein L596_009876 [Steinernema carpocapsae]|uniref:Uncharacterized protein n=1 Tax=Steinernema carpocapsae TaxID=34508 RepID=A0A4U5PGX9_STECR|nr:hypothetical protein L596_009876 [Steinernema carpocapsae]